MRYRLAVFFLLFFSHIYSQTTSLDYSKLISPDSLKQNLYILASDSLEGRETGKTGQKKAAKFLAGKYRSMRITPFGNKIWSGSETKFYKYLQDHPISIRNNKNANLFINGEKFLYGKDFIYSCGKDTTINLQQLVYTNDPADKSIKNSLDGKKGTSGIIMKLIDDLKEIHSLNDSHAPLFLITSDSLIKEIFAGRLNSVLYDYPVILISRKTADKCFPGNKLATLMKRKRNVTRIFTDSVSLSMVSDPERLRGENVLAMIPGDYPEETVVISSHYDHLGKSDSLIYYGADDNASGTSAVVEIARVFMQALNDGHRPKRNILFVNFSGEEKGLTGSSFFVSDPTVPLKNIVADLNIDMIGRVDSDYSALSEKNYMYVIGSDKLSTELHNLNEDQNKTGPQLKLDYKFNSADDPNRFYSRSDHYNFAKNGIPVIFYFDGKHADYHKPTDTPDKIDYNLLAKRTSLIFLTAWELANRDNRPLVDKKIEDAK